jgi:signal transduction histidine kinase
LTVRSHAAGVAAYLRRLWAEPDVPGLPALPRAPLTAAICLVILGWSLAVEPRPVSRSHVVAVALADLALLVALVVAGVRRDRAGLAERRVTAALGAAAALPSLALQGWYGPSSAAVAATGLAAGLLDLYGFVLYVLFVAAYGLTLWRSGHLDPAAVAVTLVALPWVYLAPMLGRRQRRLMLEQVATEERERLAREVHDVLAHTLTALSVQLEGARMLLAQRGGDPRALAAVDRARRLADAGIDETRQAVAALRGDNPPGPQSLGRLAEDFSRESGVPATFEVEGTPTALPPDAGFAIYRAAQEALTNVLRHADASSVTVRLRYADGGAELVVSDEGRARPSIAAAGYGLAGIRERAELLGGRLESGPTPDGFEVRLWVPA